MRLVTVADLLTRSAGLGVNEDHQTVFRVAERRNIDILTLVVPEESNRSSAQFLKVGRIYDHASLDRDGGENVAFSQTRVGFSFGRGLDLLFLFCGLFRLFGDRVAVGGISTLFALGLCAGRGLLA